MDRGHSSPACVAARAAPGGGRSGEAVREVTAAGRAARHGPRPLHHGQLDSGGDLPVDHGAAADAAGGRGRHDIRRREGRGEERGDARTPQLRAPAKPSHHPGCRPGAQADQIPHLRHGGAGRDRRPAGHDHGSGGGDPDAEARTGGEGAALPLSPRHPAVARFAGPVGGMAGAADRQGGVDGSR